MSTIRAVATDAAGPATLTTIPESQLGDGDVTIAVSHSSLNYKDGLAVTGTGRIMRSHPMVAGIDLAGTVETSDAPGWKPGDQVLVTGWGLSETHPGGYTERQRVRSEWVTRKPDALTLPQTMAIGTAGLTAMLCVLAIEDAGVIPGAGQVIVTGASGGVGSVAVAVLAHLGYDVAASTGSEENHDYLRSLGATTIVGRDELAAAGRPLDQERWSGGVDTVGSQTLATVLSQTCYRGSVSACGLAGGNDLPTTVLPFILRNVSLLGVDSVSCPAPVRERAWARLSSDLQTELLDSMTSIRPMSDIPVLAEDILAGRVRGRVVIDTSA